MSVNEPDDLAELRLWLVRLVVGFIALGLLVVLPYLWWLNVTPIDQQEVILGVKDSFELRNQAIKSVIASIQNFATVFGGIAILFNVYYGAKRAKALEKNAIAATENAIAATKNAEVAEQGLITERFTKAIEQLGSDNISIRLGGIYALESIAEYSKKHHWSERYHWTIMEVLSAFVRENAPLKKDLEAAEGEQQPQKLRTDIQAALTVIGRRDPEKDPPNKKLDLSNTDIRKAELPKANFQKIILSEAKLQGANLCDANLQEADLSRANLEGANLRDANLQRTKLREAKLQNANFSQANLTESIIRAAILHDTTLNKANLQRADLRFANLQRAYLDEADLQEADFSRGAILEEAHLNKANLQKANFSEAKLQGATLFGADLRGAINLKQQQLKQASGDHTTRLPDGVQAPAHWQQSG